MLNEEILTNLILKLQEAQSAKQLNFQLEADEIPIVLKALERAKAAQMMKELLLK